MAPVILCGFWECYCSLADLWSFNYPTTRWPPRRQGAEGKRPINTGITPEARSGHDIIFEYACVHMNNFSPPMQPKLKCFTNLN